MAIFHLSVKLICRSKGRSAIAAAAYRHALRLRDARTGVTHDYRRKIGVEHSEILAPHGAPRWVEERAALWNAVEGAERRRDAQLAREIEIALPAELDAAQRLALVRHWVAEQLIDHGMVADIALHAPGGEGDNRNFHAHIVTTLRPVSGAGFGPKDRAWGNRQMLRQWRESWAETCNRHLAAAGFEEGIDHRTLAAQGIDRLPTKKQGQRATAIDRRAGQTLSDRGTYNAAIFADNQRRRQQRFENARILRRQLQAVSEFVQETALDLTSPEREVWVEHDPWDELMDHVLGPVRRVR